MSDFVCFTFSWTSEILENLAQTEPLKYSKIRKYAEKSTGMGIAERVPAMRPVLILDPMLLVGICAPGKDPKLYMSAAYEVCCLEATCMGAWMHGRMGACICHDAQP